MSLQNCPCCGGSEEDTVNMTELVENYYVKCSCGLQTREYGEWGDAEDVWNNRTDIRKAGNCDHYEGGNYCHKFGKLQKEICPCKAFKEKRK